MKFPGFLSRLMGKGPEAVAPVQPISPDGQQAAPQEMRTVTSLTPEAGNAAVGVSVAEGLNKPVTAEILGTDVQAGMETKTTTIPQPANPAPAENKG